MKDLPAAFELLPILHLAVLGSGSNFRLKSIEITPARHEVVLSNLSGLMKNTLSFGIVDEEARRVK